MKDLENPKIKRIYLRVSEKDYETIKFNSENFMKYVDERAISFYIRQALIEFSNRSVIDRREKANQLEGFFREYRNRLERIYQDIEKVSNRLLYMDMIDKENEEKNTMVAKAILESSPIFTQCLESINKLQKNLKTALNKSNPEKDYPTEIRRIEPKEKK